MTKMKDAEKTFDPFVDPTSPRSEAADPPSTSAPAATFQPPTPTVPVLTGTVVDPPTLPEPHEPLSNDPELTDREREELAACEEAIAAGQRSFITMGRALHVIREGRHYQKIGYTTFEQYCRERWDMTRQQASRLILSYPLGERLSRIRDKINADQVQKLLPLADQYGDDAAITVYKTVAELREGKVTAEVIKGAVAVLPAGQFDPEQAVARIRAHLAGELKPVPATARPAEQWVTDVGRAWSALRRVVQEDAVRAAAGENPGVVKKFADDLRQLADEIEQGTK